MSNLDENSARSHQTTSSASLVPPTVLPKYFNVPFAIQHGYFRCVRYLLELSSDPNERDSQLRTPLILCSYVENDRWSLSLAQNLLEKSAKIALEDHARRNAMHHACALQRIHLVQLYLSCLDFKLGAKDCEGNTCLHYVAITGNCEIAELLMKSAEKMDIRLDQYVNREGCSAAALALRYGHIECANQITHRNWDEFFVIPRPLSIYESPPTTTDNTTLITTTTTTNASSIKKKSKHMSPPSSTTKNDALPSTISFGLLKIIFNESDSSYSTRLAGLCKKGKPTPHRRRRPEHKKLQATVEPSIPNSTHYCSTEVIVNEMQTSKIDEEEIPEYSNDSKDILHTDRSSPRVQLLIQQHLSNKAHPSTEDFRLSNEQLKSKTSIPTIYRQASGSTLNQLEPSGSLVYDTSETRKTFQRPRTALVSRNQTSVNAVGAPSRLSSAHTRTPSSDKKTKKIIHRPNSASLPPKQHQKQNHSNLASEASTYSQTLFAGRPLSALLQNHTRHPLPVQRTADTSCSIREAEGATRRYNQPEKLFGLKPEELFATTEHQPKIGYPRKTNDNSRSKRNRSQKQQEDHACQQDIDKLIDLFNIHHSSNYRPGAVPPPPIIVQTETIPDLTPAGRPRRMSGSKHPSGASKPHVNLKLSTLASLHIPRRNSITQRTAFKLINA